MITEIVSPFFTGVAVALAVASPAEWAVHRYMLHPKKRNRINRNSARGHSDIHHKAYRGPAHYYQDVTNEHAVIHFSSGDVGLIHSAAAITGFVIDRAYAAIAQKPNFDAKDLAFVGGVVSGTLAYYASYEISHHYMHVIGQRRKAINEVLGNSIQGISDGKLRFSKPLLDDICNSIELHVDNNAGRARPNSFSFDSTLIDRLEEQISYNRITVGAEISVPDDFSQATLDEVTDKMLNIEEKYRSSLSLLKKPLYWLERKVQKTLRAFPLFKYLDNHHFVHHYAWMENLNVVAPVADFFLGTETKCSKSFLEENHLYWLCPNSIDTVKFPIPERV